VLGTECRSEFRTVHRPHVFLVSNTAWSIFNFRPRLVRSLIDEGYRVTAIAPHDEYAERVGSLGCEFQSLKMDNAGTNPARDITLMLKLRRLIKERRADAVLTFTVKPNVYGTIAAWSLGVPVICNVTGLGTAFLRGGWMSALVSRLYGFALYRAAHSFFQNEDHRDDFLRRGLVPKLRCSLLPGSGVDTQRFRPRPHATREEGNFRFLLLGRMLYDKGIREYVEAARALRPRYPGVEFLLMGFVEVANRSAVSMAQIQAWIAEGLIRFLEARQDVRDVIAECDCIVLPSYSEGMPRSLLEAAAMGKPMIASDVPGCRQIVDDGENGFLATPRDGTSLAEKMKKMLELSVAERTLFGERARRKIEEHFDEQIVVDRYRSELRSLLLRSGQSKKACEGTLRTKP
jgi:glycosyltransferase involved in cell wall biosynthesis